MSTNGEVGFTTVPLEVEQHDNGYFRCSGQVVVKIRVADAEVKPECGDLHVDLALSVNGGEEYGVSLLIGEVFVTTIPIEVEVPAVWDSPGGW